MSRNPYARSLRVKPQQIVPDKREKALKDDIRDQLAHVYDRYAQEPVPPDMTELLRKLR